MNDEKMRKMEELGLDGIYISDGYYKCESCGYILFGIYLHRIARAFSFDLRRKGEKLVETSMENCDIVAFCSECYEPLAETMEDLMVLEKMLIHNDEEGEREFEEKRVA